MHRTLVDPTKLSNQRLLQLCVRFGHKALQWRSKFIGLLPEVYRRKLYEKKGFESIFDFGKRLAGLSEAHIRHVLRLDRNFEEIPMLRSLLTAGEVSMHKLIRVASVATSQNQEFLAEQVKILPSRALETLVRDMKHHRTENQDGLQKPLFYEKSLHVQRLAAANDGSASGGNYDSTPAAVASLSELKLSEQTAKRLIEFQHKGFNLNQVLNELLDQREQKIHEDKEKISADVKPTASRYIPVTTRKILKQEYGTKCSIPHCIKPSIEIHHTNRFFISKTHNPYFLAPLCREHHIIAHSVDRKFLEKRKF